MSSYDSIFGGAQEVAISGGGYAIHPDSRVFVMTPSGSSDVATLPPANRLQRGGPTFYLINLGPTHGIQIDTQTATLGTIAPGKGVRLCLIDNSDEGGRWSFSQLLDASAGAYLSAKQETYEFSISVDTPNLVVRELADAVGYNPSATADITVTIETDVEVYSESTAYAALRIGTFPSGSRVRIVNKGYISGAGAEGGAGAGGSLIAGGGFSTFVVAQTGGAGGTALLNDAPGGVTVEVDNTLGTIRGGGGGGGGGGGSNYTATVLQQAYGGGGGGGQTARKSYGGGPFVPGRRGYVRSEDGDDAGAGAGGTGGVVQGTITAGTVGGTGGSWGSAGNAGSTQASSSSFGAGGTGGAAGKAVQGNSGITWIANGTRLGPIT